MSRILAALEKEQIFERDEPSRKFRLGLGLLSFAGPRLANLDVRRVGLPVLRRLTERTSETSAIVVWNANEAVTVEQVESPHQIKHTNPIGTRYTDAESSCVQVFLADLPAASLRQRVLSGSFALRASGGQSVEEFKGPTAEGH